MNYQLLEKELKERTKTNYSWRRKQNDFFDSKTNFIYKIETYNSLQEKIKLEFSVNPDYLDFKDYALNRWYNFWSAKAVETVFCKHKNVSKHYNSKDRYTDFYISTIPFDHKTTTFPKGFNYSIPFAIEHKKTLIKWLYKNQSNQKRQHYKNRLFIVVLDFNNPYERWKLNAEIIWLKQIIEDYLCSFDASKLPEIAIEDTKIKSDIIWAIK